MKTANTTRKYRRGEIYYADLNPALGHEQGGIRPVLVIQDDAGNYSEPTLIIAPVSHQVGKKPTIATHVVLENIQGLAPSLFLLEQMRTIDKHRILRYVGKLTKEQMAGIDAALRTTLCLWESHEPETSGAAG